MSERTQGGVGAVGAVVTWLLEAIRLLFSPPTVVRKLVGQVPTDGCRNGKTPLVVRVSINISLALVGYGGNRERPR